MTESELNREAAKVRADHKVKATRIRAQELEDWSRQGFGGNGHDRVTLRDSAKYLREYAEVLAATPSAGLETRFDLEERDMIQRGDKLGPRLGAKVWAYMSALTVSQPSAERVEVESQEGASLERVGFEEWAGRRALDLTETLGPWGERIYFHPHVQSLWDGWLSRAQSDAPHVNKSPFPEHVEADALTAGGEATEFDEAAALATFTEYFVQNYPGPDTIIGKPTWHAPKIFRAALHAIRTASRPAKTYAEGVEDAAKAGWNACRKSIYALAEDMQAKPFAKVDSVLRGLGPSRTQEAHGEGFNGGWKHAGKSIARAFNSMEAEDDDNFIAAIRRLASTGEGSK